MRLENAHYTFAGVKIFDRFNGCGNFSWMVRVVVYIYKVSIFDTYIKAPTDACKSLQSVTEFVLGQSAFERYCRCGHGVLNIVKA